jgi:hypothetical protein
MDRPWLPPDPGELPSELGAVSEQLSRPRSLDAPSSSQEVAYEQRDPGQFVPILSPSSPEAQHSLPVSQWVRSLCPPSCGIRENRNGASVPSRHCCEP